MAMNLELGICKKPIQDDSRVKKLMSWRAPVVIVEVSGHRDERKDGTGVSWKVKRKRLQCSQKQSFTYIHKGVEQITPVQKCFWQTPNFHIEASSNITNKHKKAKTFQFSRFQ